VIWFRFGRLTMNGIERHEVLDIMQRYDVLPVENGTSK
jgi:hypothetical protein